MADPILSMAVDILKEKATVQRMVGYYCRAKHGRSEPCEACVALAAYAGQRLEACRYGEAKPSCAACRTHCYRPKERAEIRAVMRFVGPRMLYLAPLEAIRHWGRKKPR